MDKYGYTYITISKEALLHNARFFKEKSGKKLIAVIKSNAYGHGMLEVAEILKDEADVFAVDDLDSALTLRENQVKKPILILNPINPEYVNLAQQNDVMVTVNNIDEVKAFGNLEGELRIQVKIDTGMNRLGLKSQNDLREIINYIKDKNIKIVGIYTHFHSPQDVYYSQRQQNRFLNILNSLEDKLEYIHLCSTAATFHNWDIPESTHVRIGLGLYGIYDSPELKPVLSLYSKIVLKKLVEKAEVVGYDARFKAHEDTWIGVLPVGYSDGVIRANTKRQVYVDGQYVEIIGSICMNSLMIKLPHKNVKGDVELIGPHISALEIAYHLNTISYEVTTLLSSSIERIII